MITVVLFTNNHDLVARGRLKGEAPWSLVCLEKQA